MFPDTGTAPGANSRITSLKRDAGVVLAVSAAAWTGTGGMDVRCGIIDGCGAPTGTALRAVATAADKVMPAVGAFGTVLVGEGSSAMIFRIEAKMSSMLGSVTFPDLCCMPHPPD